MINAMKKHLLELGYPAAKTVSKLQDVSLLYWALGRYDVVC